MRSLLMPLGLVFFLFTACGAPVTEKSNLSEPKISIKELKRTCHGRIFATDEDFTIPKQPGRDALLAKVKSHPDFERVAQIFSIPESKQTDWIFRIVTLMDMGPCEFIYGDIVAYGNDSYYDFASAVFQSLNPDKVKDQFQTTYLSTPPFYMHESYPNFTILSAANVWIKTPNSKGQIRPQESMNDWIITEQEKTNLEHSELKDVTEVRYETRENSKKETVSGYYLHYTRLIDIYDNNETPGAISRWEKDIQTIQGLADLEYQTAVASLFRRCVAHHIFADGNGRTCHAWAFNILAQRKIPVPMMWANEDVLVEKEEFTRRWNKGIEMHKEYLKALQKK